MRQLLRGIAAATALSLAPLTAVAVTAAPAHAAATVNTTVTLASDITKIGFYGDYFSITAEVDATNDPDGYTTPFVGSAYLQRQAPGSSTWTTVGTDTDPSFSYFPDYDTFRGNALFRVYYTGGTYHAGESDERTYPASVSDTVRIRTARNIDGTDVSKGRTVRVRTVVKPKFGGKKVLVQKKRSGGFRTIKKVRTNRQGVAVVSVSGSRRGIRYRLVAPGDRNFVASTLTFTARVY
ncbi:hypothetical protein [Nocardioides rubriscoriae]|uniref:hypothetical protein n=1 Tax=Nocardioides rubriscoriae TaxID=642762 RepID=UPI0011DFB667|nr:hypothetical protein [Nocardioides rubriscoriae]